MSEHFPSKKEMEANRFANPKMRTIEGESDAPTTPATTAKVVTESSIPPYTKSDRHELFEDSELFFIGISLVYNNSKLTV